MFFFATFTATLIFSKEILFLRGSSDRAEQKLVAFYAFGISVP